MWSLVQWWQDWKTMRVLPFGGDDLMQQPAWLFEAFRHCEQTMVAVENKRIEEQNAENERIRRELAERGR